MEGILRHNEHGRYELENGCFFTSGNSIEVYFDDMWLLGKIEYSHEYNDYCFVVEDEGIYIYNLNGIRARNVK